jgi:MFS transporter, MFS domain-containing protein family, molybdate-anion transporter
MGSKVSELDAATCAFWCYLFRSHNDLVCAGTHLYVLYESYGFSVASLYCLGFTTGGLLSPFTGPLVDKMGRKKAAILYCLLEILINMMEQYPFLSGLIVSRMIGGFTTNLLHSVFETWLDTEYRKRGFAKAKYEVIMRDSVIVSNLAAIFSGYLAHILADHYGPIGPFRGAVSCTTIALVVVCFVWSENYGTSSSTTEHGGAPTRNMVEYFAEAATAFRNDSKMLRIGLLQGLTEGSIQIFVFLWSPTLRHYALKAPLGSMGLNRDGEPAYGLIFGAYMFVGVLGGVMAPYLRTLVGRALTLSNCFRSEMSAVECVTAGCYFLSAMMLFVPSICSDEKSWSFTASLVALMTFELLIGIFLPFEGVIRSHYFPVDARASIMGMPRIIVNAAVAVGVVSTEFIRYVALCYH